MQAQTHGVVKTFSIGFDESNYNEALQAKEVANHLGTDHTELYVSPEQAMAVIPKLPNLYCEPFGDSSQIPTFLVSELAKKSVSVSLSGDGGDELLGGYNRYFLTQNLWGKLSVIPESMRKLISASIKKIPPRFLNAAINPIQPIIPNAFGGTIWEINCTRLLG